MLFSPAVCGKSCGCCGNRTVAGAGCGASDLAAVAVHPAWSRAGTPEAALLPVVLPAWMEAHRMARMAWHTEWPIQVRVHHLGYSS